jgi:cell division protease FtsH
MSDAAPRKTPWPTWIAIAGLFGLIALQALMRRTEAPRTLPYSEFLALVEAGRVDKAEVDANEVRAELKPSPDAKKGEAAPKGPERVRAERIPGYDARPLVEALSAQHVDFGGHVDTQAFWEPLVFGWILPIAVMTGLWSLFSRRMNRRGGPLSFGKSRVKIYDRAETERLTFDDVAGVDEAESELVEVVDFLKHPEKYLSLGARIPKGVLLLGPPGTGKTLLAKCVAGEAAVAFFSMSGSDFVEMFVGVGAARIRDLFEQAKERAPCIVFIDELDAIGKSRGGLAAMGTNDEREQTLNQLLVEMDGFDASSGVVIMAATNRPEILDPALVRAGRFDRQVLVDRPDVVGREDILQVHARKLKLAAEVNLRVIAQRTPGMVGADLANLLNEAALSAARRGSKDVGQTDLEEAIDRIQLGLKKKNRVMREEEKRRVAYHESGHALVALSMKHSDPVHRVTIIPRSIGALGVTLQLPTEERYLMTRDELVDRICVMLGGRAAEFVVCGNLSTGAQNDLERATETARQMVCKFGMSERMGPLVYGKSSQARFLDTSFGEERNYSEATAQAIDTEVRAIVEAEYGRAHAVLVQRRSELEAIATRLLTVETLEQDELMRLLQPGVVPSSPLSPA